MAKKLWTTQDMFKAAEASKARAEKASAPKVKKVGAARLPDTKAVPKVKVPKNETSPVTPVKRGRPKKTDQGPPFLYLESDFYLVNTAEGYAAAAEDWWGAAPSSLTKAPDEFPAIVTFFDRSESGPKIAASWAPRKALGFTAAMTKEVEPKVTIVEKIIEKVVEVEKPSYRYINLEPTFPQMIAILRRRIAKRIAALKS